MKIKQLILAIILLTFHLNAQVSKDIYSVQRDPTLIGKEVMVIGVVTVSTGIFEPERTFIADPNGGPWSGVAIWDDAANFYAEEGKKVRVIGIVSERSGMTEILLSSYTPLSGIFPLPDVEKVKTIDIATGSPTAESYEGVLIQIDTVTVTNDNLGYGEWLVDDGSGACRIDDDADYLFYEVPATGTVVSSITGVLNYSYDNFKLEPRYQSDIVDSDTSSATNIYTIQQNISLNGKTISTGGTVTAATGIFHQERTFIADPSGGPWSGILLWDSTATFHANEGDEVRVCGKVFEDNGLTGIVIESSEILGHNNPLPPAEMINTGDISSGSVKAEIYEGVLVQVSNVFVSDPNLGNGEWLIDDGSGACRVDNDADSLIYEVPSAGSPVTSIIGIVNYSDDNYKLEPRYLSDIFETMPIPIGDTLTVIQRPIQTIPALVVPGDVLPIECEADPTTSSWTVELLRGQLQVPMEVQSAVYNPGTLWWTILVTIPEVPFYDLYNLKVTIDGGTEDISRNAVAVIPEFKDDYYFIHITDPHLPTHLYYRDAGFEKDSSEMVDLREVINDINIINPEFVLLTGDLLNEGELEEHQHHRYFTRAQRILTELNVPFFLTSGNHDLGGWSSTPPPDGTARRTWWQFFGWKYLNDPPSGSPWYTQNYSFDYGPVHYIGLEAYINYDGWRDEIYGGTSFTSGQIQWLNDNLAAASESISQVLFYHIDFKDELDLNALGVEMALWGHTHQDAGDLDGGPPYNISTRAVCDGNRSYRLIRVSNGVLQPSQTNSAGWDGNNLSVEFQPANDGTHSTLTAEINNSLNEQFEQARLCFNMPKSDNSIGVTGGNLVQVDSTDVITICYVEVDIQPMSSHTVTVSLFSNPFAENCSVSKPYLAPGIDTLHVLGNIINPGSQSIQVKSVIESFDKSFVDSILMFDDGVHDDNTAGDKIYGAYWSVPSGERYYRVHITSSSPDSGFYHELKNAAQFTTVGPIIYDSMVIVQQIGNLYRVRMMLRNAGSTTTALSVNAELTLSDTSITIEDNYRNFGNINSGQTAQSYSFYNFITQDPPNSTKVQVKIFSNDQHYWNDSFDFSFIETGLLSSDSDIPSEFALRQNYPNPFNPTTVFSYDIPSESLVNLSIYDINGRVIRTLINEKQNPGYYSVQWDASGIPSGLYFYKIQAGVFFDVKKFVLIK